MNSISLIKLLNLGENLIKGMKKTKLKKLIFSLVFSAWNSLVMKIIILDVLNCSVDTGVGVSIWLNFWDVI